MLDDGKLMLNEEGSAQGNIISPILANIYMHNVLTLIVMFCHGDNKGIYYWDDTYNFQNSDDENNMYWIANSFNEFIKLLS